MVVLCQQKVERRELVIIEYVVLELLRFVEFEKFTDVIFLVYLFEILEILLDRLILKRIQNSI